MAASFTYRRAAVRLAAALTVAGSAASAQLSEMDRGFLLEFYPCGASLSDEALQYMADWANATKNDPCQLSGAEFTLLFDNDSQLDAFEPISMVEAHFARLNRPALFVQQVLLFGREEADGLWGPQTEARFADLLETYHAIGGIGPDWGIRTIDDVPRFLDWVAAAEFAEATGGEFPD